MGHHSTVPSPLFLVEIDTGIYWKVRPLSVGGQCPPLAVVSGLVSFTSRVGESLFVMKECRLRLITYVHPNPNPNPNPNPSQQCGASRAEKPVSLTAVYFYI